MATYVKFQKFVEDMAKGVHQLHAAGHTLKAYLTNTAPNVSTHTVKTDLAGITEQHGYEPKDINNDFSRTGGVVTVTAVDIVLTATGGTFGPFQYVVVYNDTPTSPIDPLICYWNIGSETTCEIGDIFTIDFGSSLFTME